MWLPPVHDRPLLSLAGLMAFTFTVQVVVDLIMGKAAHHFNASNLLAALYLWITGRSPGEVHFLLGQEAMGAGFALLVGVGFAIGQHLIFGGLLFLLIRWVSAP